MGLHLDMGRMKGAVGFREDPSEGHHGGSPLIPRGHAAIFPKCSGALASQLLGFPREDQRNTEGQKTAEGRTTSVCTPPMSHSGAKAPFLRSQTPAPKPDLDPRGWAHRKLAGQTCHYCHLAASIRIALTAQSAGRFSAWA